MNHTFLALFLAGVLALNGCGYFDTSEGPVQIDKQGDQVLITDRSGKSWDVTHAQVDYGFSPAAFQYGLGPNVIASIDNPQMLVEADADYPSAKSSFWVLGASINGFFRAYPIGVLSRHEVANEVFGEAHVAVAY